MNLKDARTSHQMVEEIGRIGRYAPGSYACTCVTCAKPFIGDKRAVQCLPCAVRALQRAAELVRILDQAALEAEVKRLSEPFDFSATEHWDLTPEDYEKMANETVGGEPLIWSDVDTLEDKA